MPGTTGTKVAYFAAGAVITVAAATALSFLGGRQFFPTSGEDEERPPIIVRGGSVIFESGEGAKKGKKWKHVNDDWQPDHGMGIPVTKFTVAIQGGNDQCPALERTHELSVTYTDETGASATFFITTKARDGTGTPAPTLVTDKQLTLDNSGDYPKLTYGTAQKGSITHVKFLGIGGHYDCQGNITTVKLWQDQ